MIEMEGWNPLVVLVGAEKPNHQGVVVMLVDWELTN